VSKQDKQNTPLQVLDRNLEKTNGCLSNKPLKATVGEALLSIVTDNDAPAAARASAGRTLLEYFSDNEHAHGSNKRSAEMSLAELDEEIARELAQR
jgi:hypothetical protein